MSRMQGKTVSSTQVFVGLDVSRYHLDIPVHPLGQHFRVGNDPAGLKDAIRRLLPLDLAGLVMEATGRYHRLAHEGLFAAGLPVAVVNPLRTRRVADTLGQLAKTDRIDARTLALFAAMITPQTVAPESPALARLRELLAARRQLCEERVALQSQLRETTELFIVRQIQTRIRTCQRHEKAISERVTQHMASDPALKHGFALLTSLPGVALITAATLIPERPQLGQASGAQIAALVGAAPMNSDSGTFRGTRRIRGGRRSVRNALYMAAIRASRLQPAMRHFYDRLRAAGKPFKVAITAVLRKLAILANSLIKQNRPWQPRRP